MGVRVHCCLAAALVCGCGGGGRADGPEGRIAADLGRQLGVEVDRVRCPAGAYPKTCVATIAGADVELAVTEGADGIAWTLEGFVISMAPLAAQIAIELDDLGVEATVDCGAPIRVTHVGERLQCALHGGVEGAALIRIVDEEARFDLELALDPAAVHARTVPADRAELERLSRALDIDGELGEDEDSRDGGPRRDGGGGS
jgi:hypothetical protein